LNNLDMNGGIIETMQSIAWKNNPIAAGQLRTQCDVVGKNNATIIFDGTEGASANQGVGCDMVMYSEY